MPKIRYQAPESSDVCPTLAQYRKSPTAAQGEHQGLSALCNYYTTVFAGVVLCDAYNSRTGLGAYEYAATYTGWSSRKKGPFAAVVAASPPHLLA